MTILDLAEETGVDGYQIRMYIKQKISQHTKDHLPKPALRIYHVIASSQDRVLGSVRKPCFDCGAKPPVVNPDCRRCRRREKDRQSADLRRQARRNATPMCNAHALDRVYSSDCPFRATQEINGIPVCGVHSSRYMSRVIPRTKCEAHKISDRFNRCEWKAKSFWKSERLQKEVPVCGRHKSALSGSYGEQQLDEVWRNKTREQRLHLKQVDRT